MQCVAHIRYSVNLTCCYCYFGGYTVLYYGYILGILRADLTVVSVGVWAQADTLLSIVLNHPCLGHGCGSQPQATVDAA